MTLLPDFDPYEALGVTKDATVAEIKSSHRKLVLKCHPDKIKDESRRSEALDQFQKVQQAYECLSDEATRTKYDNKVKLAELKREMMSRGASYSRPGPREYRDGRFYEERVPADARSSAEAFFEEEVHPAESPRPTSRKHDEFGSRPRSKTTDEKKRSSKAPPSSFGYARAAKEARESAKATRADRDKYRTKERRRQSYNKHVYPESDSYDSDSGRSEVYYIPVKKPSESRRYREAKPRPTEFTRRTKSYACDGNDDYFSRERGYKHDMQYSSARDYIRRSKETIPETDRRHRSSRSPHDQDAEEPEAKPSGRSKRSGRDGPPPSSRHGSFEDDLDPLPRVVPSMPTASTFPSPKTTSSPRPPQSSSRPANVRSSYSTRETSRRSEPVYMGMGMHSEPRTSKLRGERSDSGYASSSPTPDVPHSADASPKPPRYKSGPEPVVVEPRFPTTPPLRSSRTYSPPRQERRMPPRSNTTTYAYPSETTSRRLFREVEADEYQKERELRRARDVHYIRPSYAGHTHSDYVRPVGSRRASAYVS